MKPIIFHSLSEIKYVKKQKTVSFIPIIAIYCKLLYDEYYILTSSINPS